MFGRQWPDGKTSRLFYATLRLVARVALPCIVRLRTEGLKNIPRSGPVILAMNHIHWLDIPSASLRVPRVTHYMAKVELFNAGMTGWMLRHGGAFPVRRGEGDREALRTAERLLSAGEVVVVFPEGHRSDDGALIQAHPGVALIALRSNAPVVPVAISGTRDAFKHKRFLFWAPRVTVRYGAPFRLGTGEGRRSRESLAEATGRIMYAIAALLPPEQRGPYANPPLPITSAPETPPGDLATSKASAEPTA
jgi:1-acyl-sn-glycerol-3-phosphate acyltransferase